MEFFLNRAELSLNSANSGNLKITETRIWAQFKDPVSTGVLLASWPHTRGGCVAGLSPIFLSLEFSETFRKNSIEANNVLLFKTMTVYL